MMDGMSRGTSLDYGRPQMSVADWTKMYKSASSWAIIIIIIIIIIIMQKYKHM